MLTLKQLLESDSLATIVAKLNQNFQVLSNSNGGPQGIRGSQGIPGLPGKMGPIGSTGAAGPTGTILGVIPFAKDNVNTVGIGPSVITTTEYGIVGPWPSSSYDWLDNYQSTASAGEIFIDHRNNGYWKYLTAPDVDGAAFPGYTTGNPYQYPAAATFVYPNLGPGSSPTVGGNPGFYAGAGWYFYPGQDASASGVGTVWVEDYTTYLQSALQSGTGPYGPTGPFDGTTANPLKIPNARLVSKYGTVWITSGNDATDNNSDGDLRTSNIGKWGLGSGSSDAQPGRYNAGVDRLLFKMSIDGLSYQSNITARGYTGPATMVSPNSTPNEMVESTIYPIDNGGISFPSISTKFWAKPQYEVTLDKYSPILFLSHRNEINSATQGTYGTLGIYLYTDILSSFPVEYDQPNDPYGYGTLTDNNVSKTIHLFTSRYSPDPMVEWDNTNQPLNSAATLNFGEMVLDFRRVIASNQYVCSTPADMKLSSDYRITSSILGQFYNENPLNSSNQPINTNRYKTFQGYISSINGKSLSGDAESPYYLEYGLGSNSPTGTAGAHDLSSGTAGMITRRTWYGTSALDKKEFNGVLPGTNDYVRVAGMLERGRRVKPTLGPGGFPEASKSYFLSELIFYTSQFGLTGITGQQIDIDDVNLANNHHNSLPSLYISPFRNIGIGTFVGVTGGADGGPLEPLAKFHVHVKPMDRANDPTYDYKVLPAGVGQYESFLPTNVFAAAAFSGQLNDPDDRRAVTDILLGNVIPTLNERIDPSGNVVNQLAPGFNSFKNAIRTESWLNAEVSTMHLGATPVSTSNSSIGRNSVESYKKEFQISLAPLNPSASLTAALRANTGVGIHNMFPRARFHMFGKNLYNETAFGLQPWTPSGIAAMPSFAGLSGSYPFYGTTGTNSPSANQVVIDYIGSSYNYPVGIYEYQYWAFPGNTGTEGTYSPNSAVYPNREQLGVTRWINSYTTAESANFAFPSANPAVNYLGSYKHGGTANAFWDPQTYIGFNLFRDLSSANGNTKGDDRDDARWTLGTQGAIANGHGNNGGAAIISSTQGELGIITIPRGRDGGRAYEQWEQRGLGTRDVLNQMKIVFDKNGNIAIGNAAGWDLDAYPSLNLNMASGKVNYLPSAAGAATTLGPYVYQPGSVNLVEKYGQLTYSGYPEGTAFSSSSIINARATSPEYIRLEVGAEKAWSRDGRMLQRLGWGYPANRTIVLTGSTLLRYVKTNFTGLPYNVTVNSWTLITDYEGRIVDNFLNVIFTGALPTPGQYTASPITQSNINVVVFPHPSEFNTGSPLNALISSVSFIAPAGAIAAEWWGMDNDSSTQNNATVRATPSGTLASPFYSSANIHFIPTTDLRGSANVRLNNFVYGEGFGISGGTQGGGSTRTYDEGNFTKAIVQRKRQESPKLILSFLEKTPTEDRNVSGKTPYLKVNTVIQSAQNEASLREYWIPKAANTGGTFMVFTDFLGQKEKDTGFNQTPINNTGLFIEQVVTQEFLAGYTTYRRSTPKVTAAGEHISIPATLISPLFPRLDFDAPLYYFYNNKHTTDPYKYAAITPLNLYPGYVRYFNKAYNHAGAPAYFTNTEFGQIVPTNELGQGIRLNTIAQTQADPIKHYSVFRTYPTTYPNPNVSTDDTGIYVYFGDGSNCLTFMPLKASPSATAAVAGYFNWYLVEDSKLPSINPQNVSSLTDIKGTVVTKVNREPSNSANRDFSVFERNSPNAPFGQNPQGVKVTIKIKGKAEGTLYRDYRKLGCRLIYDAAPPGQASYDIAAFRAGLVSNSVGSTQSGNNQPAGQTPNYMTLNSDSNKLVANFEISQYVYNNWDVGIDGEDYIYMDWAQWNTRTNWSLCFAYMPTNTGTYDGFDSPSEWVLSPYVRDNVRRPLIPLSSPYYPTGGWNIDNYEVKFEYVWGEAGLGLTNFDTAVGVSENGTVPYANNASSIRRNIDKYYEIYKPSYSTQPEFGDVANVDNQATQIRVKRINSEYALVDYNITVKVMNPVVVQARSGDPAGYIDFCSPRFTQYLRFIYTPDPSGSAGLSNLTYGEDLSLINWSSYKNWLPGTAIVGDDMWGDYATPGSTVAEASTYNFGPVIGNAGAQIRTMTDDWSPFYNDQITQEFGNSTEYFTTPMTWNGNILENVAYASYWQYFVEESVGKGNTRFSTLTRPLRSFYNVGTYGSDGGFTANGASEDYMRNTTYAAFGSDTRILANAYWLFPYTSNTNGVDNAKSASPNPNAAKQLGFVGYLGSMYALWKNEAFLRNKSTQWRILPAEPYLTGDFNGRNTNSSFYLEVQLSTPILHCDVPFGSYFYGQKFDGADVTPYRFLTLNGQAIVKFKETEVFNRPLAPIGDPSYSGGGFPTPPGPIGPGPVGPVGPGNDPGFPDDPFDGGWNQGPNGPGGIGGDAFNQNQEQTPGLGPNVA